MGRLGVASRMFESASRYVEESDWRDQHREPHGAPWWGSFHASKFPGDDERACERALVYDALGIPEVEPFGEMLRATMVAGQAAEDWRAHDLDLDGRLLSPPATAEHQMRFEDADHWLTGSPDIVVLPPFTNRPHLVETKTKDLELVVEMKNGQRLYDAKHARQCRVGIALGSRIAHRLWPRVVVCRETWRLALAGNERVVDSMVCRDHGIHADSGCLITIDLLPMRTGELLYMGRDRLSVKHGYLFEHDEEWFQHGLAVVERARQHLLAGTLPPHPFGGKDWSVPPCKWCGQKKETCKPDHKAGVVELVKSNGARWAAEVHGGFSIERRLEEMTARWAGQGGYRGVFPEDYELAALAA